MYVVTNIAQRHANPELQAATTDELYPRHKQLLIRRSVRCKVSEIVCSASDGAHRNYERRTTGGLYRDEQRNTAV